MRGGEGDPVAAAGGLDAERDRQMRLAGARRSQEHHVGGLPEEVELGQVGDLGAADRALEGVVDVVQGLDLGEVGGLDAGVAAVGLPGGHLLGQHLDQLVLVVPAFGAGLVGQGGDPGGLQRPGQERDLAVGPHLGHPAGRRATGRPRGAVVEVALGCGPASSPGQRPARRS
jgi:hypothetical protein